MKRSKIILLLLMVALSSVFSLTPLSIGGSPPRIIAWHPPEPEVFNTEGDTRHFIISVDQVVNVTWRTDGSVVQTNENVTFAVLTIVGEVSPGPEHWRVSATVENPNGADVHTWVWNVPSKRYPPPTIIICREPLDPRPSNEVGETRTFGVTLEEPCIVYWVGNEAHPGSPAYALVDEYHRGIEGEVDVTPIPDRLEGWGLVNERVIRRDVNVGSSRLEMPAVVVGTFSIMAAVQYNEAAYMTSSWAWEIKSPTRWPLIAGIGGAMAVVMICIAFAFYKRKHQSTARKK